MKLNVCMAIIPLREISGMSVKTNEWARNSSHNQTTRQERARINAGLEKSRSVALGIEDKARGREI